MLRNKAVSFVLLFCFALISLHDIVPHAHVHGENLAKNNPSPFENSQEKKAKDAESPINIFSHIPHAGAESTACLTAMETFVPIAQILLFLHEELWQLNQLWKIISFKTPNSPPRNISIYISSIFTLRGPPAY